MKIPPPPRTIPFTTKGGLETILAPVPDSPVVSTWVWYRVGSRNERPGITGAAHWLEHMLFKGSTHYAAGKMDRAIVGVGGYLNAFTDNDFTAYISIVPREKAGMPIAIEADRMTGATLPSSEIDHERSVVLSEREMNENSPSFRVEEELHALAFHVHPYRWSTLGYVQDIRAMDREHLHAFYDRFYGPANATLVVAGGFEPVAMRRMVEHQFEGVDHPVEPPIVSAVEPHQRSRREATLRGPGSTPIVRIAWHGPEISSPRAAACMLLEMHLGGEAPLYTPGHAWEHSREHPSSVLYQSLVDRKLAVSTGCDWSACIQPGLFSVSAKASPGVSAGSVERALVTEVDKVRRKGIPAEALKELRRRLLINASMLWSGASMMGFRLGYFRSLGTVALERRILRRAMEVTPSEIRDEAGKLFDGAETVVRYLPEGT